MEEYKTLVDIFSRTPDRESITSILGKILNDIEDFFGPRDHAYTILGIELSKNGPQLIFSDDLDKGVIIRITDSCRFDIVQAVFQVAHEAFHCLHPTTIENVSYLEEGLATLFSYNYTNDNYGQIRINDKKYEKATALARSLLLYNPNIIKELRELEVSISKFTPDIIINNTPNIPHDLAIALTTKFQQNI